MINQIIDKIKDFGLEERKTAGLGNLYDSVELQNQERARISNHNNIFINKESDSKFYNKTRVRDNREYMISLSTALDLNAYTGYNPFWTFTDQYILKLDGTDENGIAKESTEGKLMSSMGVHSIFNKYSAVALAKSEDVENASEWRLSNNVPLMDNRKTRAQLKGLGTCTIKDLVIASSHGWLGRETYSYSDFMYCKHLGKIPNNYLITLRRFPMPVDDFISRIGATDTTLLDKKLKNNNSLSIGCLVTWIGTPGNEMSNLLKYSYNMPFKELNSLWETPQTGDAQLEVGAGKLLNNIAASFDPTYIKHATSGEAVMPFGDYMKKILGDGAEKNPYDLNHMLNWKDSNKVYGPVDAIKSTYMRSADGLKFDQNITLTFDYELRAYNGINGRLAMLDLIANILAVTYTTGTFWGGGYRGGGAHQNNIFTNLLLFKSKKGGFNEFVDAFALDYSTVTEGFRNKLEAQGGDNWMQNAMSLMKSALNMMGGMLLGGMLNKLGRPLKVFANSLLSRAPVGFWHVTIGNPFHPIMSMGNMILKNTTIEHYGPLGLDDFPTGLKVTCELTRGKPRDLRDIENLYMHGNDRIYSSMGPKIKDMYDSAKEYKSFKQEDENADKSLKAIDNKKGAERAEIPSNSIVLKLKLSAGEYKQNVDILMRNFGDTDMKAIEFTAKEMEYGAAPKKKDSK